MEYIGAQQY